MSTLVRRAASGIIAAAVIVSMGLEPAFAQVTPGAPTVGPAGGVSSTTAPSNGQGTPAGGTGTLSTTRVGPAVSTPVPAYNTAPTASPAYPAQATPTRRVRRRRVYRRVARPTQTGTQSQAGTNGAMPAATR